MAKNAASLTMQLSDKVLQAARGGWPGVLGAMGVATQSLNGQHGPCPGCGGGDRFRFDDKEGDGTFICSQGGGGILSGNGIDLLAHVRGIQWKEALCMLGKHLGVMSEKGEGTPAAAKPRPYKTPPIETIARRQEFDPEALERHVPRDLVAGAALLFSRSPVWPVCEPEQFIGALYKPGEKVLIFNNEKSRGGQFGARVGDDNSVVAIRLAKRPGMKNELAERLPRGGRCGVWFLSQPVDGEWKPNGRIDKDGQAILSRRSEPNVTAWRYMLLESDDAAPQKWLSLLVSMPLPVAAIYTSGGRSIHALVEVNARSKAEWDGLKERLAPLLTRLGADYGALTAVRLTRLPGAMRYGKEAKGGEYIDFKPPRKQTLLYLNPSPQCQPISGMAKVWKF